VQIRIAKDSGGSLGVPVPSGQCLDGVPVEAQVSGETGSANEELTAELDLPPFADLNLFYDLPEA